MDYQMVPENGQGAPERTPDPAGAILAADLGHPPPLRPDTPTLPPRAAPLGNRAPPARLTLRDPWPPRRRARSWGQPVHHLPPRTTHAGTTSRRCSSTIRAPLLSWRPTSSTPASRRSSCPSRSGRSHCCPPGRATIQEPRNCARRSSSTARSGTASKTSPVKLERPLLASAPDECLDRPGYTTGTVSCVFS